MKKLNQAGFHLLYVVVVLVIIGAIALVGWRVAGTQRGDSGGKSHQAAVNRNDLFVQQYGNNCDDKPSPAFTSSPIATDQVGYIIPMGQMSDGHVTPTDHVYVAPLNPDAADNSYNVVMPADGKVVYVAAMPAQYIGDKKDTKTAPEDHRIVVSFNCQYYSIFIHVHQLSDKLKAEVGDLTPNTNKQLALNLRAGDPIGKIGGNPVDWTMVDTEATLKGFISPRLYEREPWKMHTIDPFSMYKGTLRSQLEAKSLRSEKPIGGKIDYDKRGALVGNWFKSGTNGYEGTSPERYWDGHLSVVPDHIDPNSTIVSIGNWQGSAKQFAVKGTVDPSQITKANSPVKYELMALNYETPEAAPWNPHSGFVRGLKVSQHNPVAGTIMFEVQDGEKLRVETFPGKTAAQVNVLTPAAQIYER